jgi:hypothetical protein
MTHCLKENNNVATLRCSLGERVESVDNQEKTRFS